MTAGDLTKAFKRAREQDIEQILETLASLGQARRVGTGIFTI